MSHVRGVVSWALSYRFLLVGSLMLALILLAGCGGEATPEGSGKLNVTVSILPQRYFLERIGGDYVDVNVMVLPGESPVTYEPEPEQLRALSEADAYFSIGVPFENAWLDRISALSPVRRLVLCPWSLGPGTKGGLSTGPKYRAANPEMLMVDTTEGIERIGGPENPNPHIWLSPRLVKVQARTIYEALADLDPEHGEAYRANLEAFIADIEELDSYIRERLSGIEDEERKFMVFHPAWVYFARDYDLEMIPIEVGGKEPSASELTKLVARAREENIQVIFAQPQFSAKAAKTIAGEIGGQVLFIDPLAPNWLENMRHVTEKLAEILEGD